MTQTTWCSAFIFASLTELRHRNSSNLSLHQCRPLSKIYFRGDYNFIFTQIFLKEKQIEFQPIVTFRSSYFREEAQNKITLSIESWSKLYTFWYRFVLFYFKEASFGPVHNANRVTSHARLAATFLIKTVCLVGRRPCSKRQAYAWISAQSAFIQTYGTAIMRRVNRVHTRVSNACPVRTAHYATRLYSYKPDSAVQRVPQGMSFFCNSF